MEIVNYDRFGSLIEPKNELEQEFCCLFILPEDPEINPIMWDQFGPLSRKAFLEGGQLVWDKGWSEEFLVHYKIDRKSITRFRFPVSVSVWSPDRTDAISSAQIYVSLTRHKIPLGFDQIRGERMDGREHQIHPYWSKPGLSEDSRLFSTRELDIAAFDTVHPPHRILFDFDNQNGQGPDTNMGTN